MFDSIEKEEIKKEVFELKARLAKLESNLAKISKPSNTYSIGDKFIQNFSDDPWVLASAGIGLVILIRISDGHRWAEPHKVLNSFKITEEEFRWVAVNAKFSLKEKGKH